MGEVVPARTSPTLHPPSPSHCTVIILFNSVPVHQLSWLALYELRLKNIVCPHAQVSHLVNKYIRDSHLFIQ